MMARPRFARLVTRTVFASVVAVVLGLWLIWFIRIDKCRDAGGAWNPDTRRCEGQRSAG